MYRFGRTQRRFRPFSYGRRKYDNKKTLSTGPSATSLSFKGPVVSRFDKANTNEVVVVLRYYQLLTSTAGSQIENTYPLDNPSGALNWSDYSTVFDEYRVLASDIKYEPSNQYTGPSTTVVNPIATVVDRDGSGPLTAFNNAIAYGSFEMHNLSRPWIRTYRMEGTREAVYSTTAAPGTTGSFLLYAGMVTASTTYGYVVQTWRVQFRGTL